MFEEVKINPERKAYYLQKGYWTDQTLKDCWEKTVRNYPDREYVVDDQGCRYTYLQMDKAAAKVAAYLHQQGIRTGDVVSFQLPIWSEFAMMVVACLKLGVVMHPISMSYEESELIRCMNVTESKAYIGPTFFHKTDYESRIMAVKNEIGKLKVIVLVDKVKKKINNVITLQEILKNSELNWNESFYDYEKKQTGKDIALILCTSGTTSGTKGVLLTHDNIRYSESVFNQELGLTYNDIMFMPAPLNHATGFHHGLISPMLLGAKVILQQKYQCREAIELMNKEHATYSMGATPFIYDILRELEVHGGNLPYLKFYLCGGAPVPGYMVQKAWKFGIRLCEVYGSTESAPHAFVRPSEAIDLNGTTSGRAINGVEIRVVDEFGRDVPLGTPGEELSRGPQVFVGYLKAPNITNEALDEDGWFHSGDLCVMDECGNIKIIGRKKDMIVRGGENLNSNEINDNLEGCPGVGDHTIIGMPDERLGERICAFVVPKPGYENLRLEDLREWLKDNHVPKRFWPEHLELINRIPHTGSGKVKKYLLKQELEQRLAAKREEG